MLKMPSYNKADRPDAWSYGDSRLVKKRDREERLLHWICSTGEVSLGEAMRLLDLFARGERAGADA